MIRETYDWWSPNLNRKMEIVMYGHDGFALLLLPTAAADYLEYERFHLIDAIKDSIDAGKCRVFSINSINSESWLNSEMNPRDKAIRHQQFNKYVEDEVTPFIHNNSGGKVPIIISGASLGAYHSANMLFRRPDLFDGVIAMSGIYDLKKYTNGYFDDDCYFNSPVDYLPQLNDEEILKQLRAKEHIHFVTGRGKYEDPKATTEISEILTAKDIPHTTDFWGYDMEHDWPTWRAMLPYYLEAKFT